MNSCCIYTGVCGVECSGKDTEVDINSCKVAKELDKLIDHIQNLKREKEKYYQMTLDNEIQINELWQENTKLKEEKEKLKEKLKEQLEKIKGICKEAIRLCDCPDADSNFDCIDCTDGGRAKLAKEIIEVLKDG